MKTLPKIVFFGLLHLSFFLPSGLTQTYVRYQEPEFLTFEELVSLVDNPSPGGALGKKLETFWHTPIISNEAYYEGVRAEQRISPLLGPTLRVVSWNVEKSYQIKDAITAFTSPDEFQKLISREEAPADSALFKKIMRQQSRLMDAGVILLQEMDIGVKRSNYIDAAREMAKALRMNYAYATEQLEIDPVYLGLEKVESAEGGTDTEATKFFVADPLRYKGLFGVAVLSKYPIKNAVSFQLNHHAYDWYGTEKKKHSFLEHTRRFGTKVVFKNELTREIKAGGRNYFRVDLDVPELPEGTLTIINVHLEIKCQPKERQKQMKEILSYIRDIKNPVILAGDFNAAPEDLSPTSVTRTLTRTAKNPTTWFAVAVNAFTPHGLVVNTTRTVSNVTKNFNNPFASHIPVIGPNKVKPMFEMIRNYRFSDGGAFDFRGDSDRSINGKSALLANSNQRGRKGFKTTFRVKRPITVFGKYRLDWIFVKSYLKEEEDYAGPYRFAPHFGETLEEMNTNLIIPISDHHPNVVDIPFNEPDPAKLAS